ncbi:MAG: MBOAT family protein [Chitinophagales bacterium]|nr:MBOAT family protein [Chitinophagales bacterium]
MLFNSFQFAIFWIVVTSTYFLLPHRLRWLLLLISSCYFYMVFKPIYILILGFTIVIDYFAGIMIEQAEGAKRKQYLLYSLIANIGVLAVFKYWNFFNENFSFLTQNLGFQNPIPMLEILLPIGLSFHTFQAMSYTIEVYRGHQKAETHFGIYALYVMFYPQLVAGPIERPQNVLHQYHEKHKFNYYNLVEGLKYMIIGFFKKVVIADRLAMMADVVYNNPTQHEGIPVILATFFFSIQIYCDFSGYSDIAIGTAKIMGFDLMDNFRVPYYSTSISEFWKRWHISLSTWFRDYLYISMGGNRTSKPRWYFNLFFTFLVSGFWHGANWTFIIWGAIHGFYLVFAIVTENIRSHINKALGLVKVPFLLHFVQMIITYLLVCFAWIFFRARNVTDAFEIIRRIPRISFKSIDEQVLSICSNKPEFLIAIGSILLLEIIHQLQRREQYSRNIFGSYPTWLRWSVFYVMIFMIILTGVQEGGNFIYFQF